MGGTCCVTRDNYDDCMDYYFDKLPISKSSTSNVIKDLVNLSLEDSFSKQVIASREDTAQLLEDYNRMWGSNTQAKDDSFVRMIPHTNFQSFIYKYLIVENYEVESINYFLDIYKEIKHNIRYPVIKFILVLLSNQGRNSQKLIAECLSYFSVFITCMVNPSTELLLKSVKFVDSDDLIIILKYYIQAVTAYSVKSLMKPLMKEFYSHKVKSHYLNFWNDKSIEDFIKKTFFTAEEIGVAVRNIEAFIKAFYSLLISPSEIRKLYSEYVINEEVDKEIQRRLRASPRKGR